MKKYVSPELEVLKLNVIDVITASAEIEGGSGNGDGTGGDGNVGGEMFD